MPPSVTGRQVRRHGSMQNGQGCGIPGRCELQMDQGGSTYSQTMGVVQRQV